MLKKGLFSIFIFGMSQMCGAEEAIIINATASPLQIVTYKAAYNEGGSYTREGIRHEVSLKNIGEQSILAYEITFSAFNVFKEHMRGNLGGTSIERIVPGVTRTGAWIQSPYAAFQFKNYGIGVAFVSAVRLDDGTIWRYDEDYVLSELKKVEDSLTKDVFKSDEGK